MIKFLKKIIKYIFKLFNLEIRRFYPELEQLNFEELYQKTLEGNVIVFDVGANKGQSIEKFKKIFKNVIIHSFEPILFEFTNLQKKYSNEKNIILNNFALGHQEEEKNFYINKYTGSSSFFKTIDNTDWINLRSKQFGIKSDEFLKNTEKVPIKTIDKYCHEKKIDNIDILKIDTQGYEDKVLEGSKNIINNNRIKFIELEIIFSDIYEKTLSIGQIENLLNNKFRLFANDYYGNLYSNKIYQLNLIYINKNFFNKISSVKQI